jgi:hypothetical protein
MALSTYNEFIERVTTHSGVEQLEGEVQTATTSSLFQTLQSGQMVGNMRILPTLPTGVTAYIPTTINLSSTILSNFLVAKVINLGSIDISGASGTFTDGSAMPTITELGTSRVTCSAVIAEVTTALNATPGSLAITYTDQDGNSQSTTAQSMTASSTTGNIGYIFLNAGDSGVRDITAATRSAGTTPTGVIQFWGVIPLAMVSCSQADIPEKINMITQHFSPIRLGAGDDIRVISTGTSSAKRVIGIMNLVGDN